MDHINNLYRQIQDSRVVQSTKLFLNTPIGKSLAIGIIIALGFYLLRGSWYPKLFSAKKLDGQQKDGASTPPLPLNNGALPTHSHQTTPSRPNSTFIDDDFPLLSESATNNIPPRPLPRPQRNNSAASSNGPPPKVPPRRGRHRRSLSNPLTNVSALLPAETATNPDSMPSSLSQLFVPPAPPLPVTGTRSSPISTPSNPAHASSSHRTTSQADLLSGPRASMMLNLKKEQPSPDRTKPSSRPPSGNWSDWEDDWGVGYAGSSKSLTEEERKELDELRKYAESPLSDLQSNSTTSQTTADQTSSTTPAADSSCSLPAPSPQPSHDPALLKRLSNMRSARETVAVRKKKP